MVATVTAEPGSRTGLRPGWPLSALFLGFPVWWALGVSHFVFAVAAACMVPELVRRRRRLVVPRGFWLWLLFLVWTAAGAAVIWAHAPGTAEVTSGFTRLLGYGYWTSWYVAGTVVLLYVLNLEESELPGLRVARLLGYMFVVTSAFGVAAVVVPEFEFPSPVELLLPGDTGDSSFAQAMVHPSLVDDSDILGLAQPRPRAPFAYANSWGNNLAMYLPFFVLAWLGREGGWRRRVGPVLLLLSVVPIAYSLNRALWLSLVVAGVYVGVRLALNGRIWAVQALLGAALVTGVALTATPLYDVVTLRLETPHSNERRLNIAEQVVTTTWQGSPLVGYGSTRDVEGSFASVAGGSTESCQGCKPPPLGTQGFLWRLLLTTGFAGTALCLGFLLDQLRRHSRGARPFAVTGCTVVVVSLLLFLVYDSLESPFFTLMIAVALMVREDMGRKEGEHETSPGGP